MRQSHAFLRRAVPFVFSLSLPLLAAACADRPELPSHLASAHIEGRSENTAYLGSGSIKAAESYDFRKNAAAHHALCTWEPTLNPNDCL